MADGNAAAWTFLSALRAYRAAWRDRAGAPEYEDAPFPVRLQSEADLAARAPWRMHAWEDPFDAGGPLAPFWDAPMLEGEGAAGAPPFLPLLAAPASRVCGCAAAA